MTTPAVTVAAGGYGQAQVALTPGPAQQGAVTISAAGPGAAQVAVSAP